MNICISNSPLTKRKHWETKEDERVAWKRGVGGGGGNGGRGNGGIGNGGIGDGGTVNSYLRKKWKLAGRRS